MNTPNDDCVVSNTQIILVWSINSDSNYWSNIKSIGFDEILPRSTVPFSQLYQWPRLPLDDWSQSPTTVWTCVISSSIGAGSDIILTPCVLHCFQGPLLLKPAWISNYIYYKLWGEITYPFQNCKGTAVEVLKLISNFVPYFTGHEITYSCWG